MQGLGIQPSKPTISGPTTTLQAFLRYVLSNILLGIGPLCRQDNKFLGVKKGRKRGKSPYITQCFGVPFSMCFSFYATQFDFFHQWLFNGKNGKGSNRLQPLWLLRFSSCLILCSIVQPGNSRFKGLERQSPIGGLSLQLSGWLFAKVFFFPVTLSSLSSSSFNSLTEIKTLATLL